LSFVTPTERSLAARAASFASWKKTSDPAARTAPAREAANRRFEVEVDPDRVLSEEERQRRAAYARREYFARLALKSAQARRRRRDELRHREIMER